MSRDDDNLIYMIAFGLWLFWKYAGSSTVVITDPGTGQPVGTDPNAPVTPYPGDGADPGVPVTPYPGDGGGGYYDPWGDMSDTPPPDWWSSDNPNPT